MNTDKLFVLMARATMPLKDGRQPKLVFATAMNGTKVWSLSTYDRSGLVTEEMHCPMGWDSFLGANRPGEVVEGMRASLENH